MCISLDLYKCFLKDSSFCVCVCVDGSIDVQMDLCDTQTDFELLPVADTSMKGGEVTEVKGEGKC